MLQEVHVSQVIQCMLCLHVQSFPNRDVEIKVSYIEIYKEELQDLLDIEASSKDLHIREDEEGQTSEL